MCSLLRAGAGTTHQAGLDSAWSFVAPCEHSLHPWLPSHSIRCLAPCNRSVRQIILPCLCPLSLEDLCRASPASLSSLALRSGTCLGYHARGSILFPEDVLSELPSVLKGSRSLLLPENGLGIWLLYKRPQFKGLFLLG